jgi:hypothetical protein
MSDPAGWFDHRYWGPGGVDISRWGKGEVMRGVAYIDHGPSRDGAKGQVRKMSSGRKARGSAASDYDKAQK